MNTPSTSPTAPQPVPPKGDKSMFVKSSGMGSKPTDMGFPNKPIGK